MFRWTSIFAAIALSTVAIAADETIELLNLVPDGSVEGTLSGNGMPLNWEVYPANFATLSAYVRKGGRTGERHLRMQSSGDMASIMTPKIAVKPGSKQFARVWYRATPAAGGFFIPHIAYYMEDMTWVGSSGAHIAIGQTKDQLEWQAVDMECIGSKFRAARWFRLAVSISEPGTVLLDDFSLKQTETGAGANLLPHGDMELDPADLAKAFEIVKADQAVTAAYSLDEENPHAGKKCLHFTSKSPGALVNVIDFEIPPNRTLRGSAWIRGHSTNGHFRLYGWNEKGKVFEFLPTFLIGQAWKEAQWTLSPEQTAGATRMTVELGGQNEFDVYYDDVSIRFE